MEINQYENIVLDIAQEVVRFLIKKGARRQDAEDIAQDVMVKLIEANIILEEIKLRPWFYKVALSKFYDKYRRNKRYESILYELYNTSETANTFHTKLNNSNLPYEVLDQLSHYQLQLIYLKYDEQRTIKFIANELHFSQAKIKIDLFRTRTHLKKLLEKYKNE
ncbi:RNA polymerase sigma factor [Leuconostoc suionicum]|uniref:RNA polymerase sigma factor n=1 Tax=Leuconostoc suionicum TaxID=1511761 RepID=UPI001B8AD3C1|nr:RNA polymerase sigma factor [Leuconostoc suionicum]MBS1008671.1 RNA polymerase sigma factor [Leuconostoc suionicum]